MSFISLWNNFWNYKKECMIEQLVTTEIIMYHHKKYFFYYETLYA